jgi:hypothetical protein
MQLTHSLKAPGFNLWSLSSEIQVSKFAFKFNLYRYNVEPRRFYKDLETMYLTMTGGGGGALMAGGGSGGALVIDVAGALRLPATNRDTRTSNPYLEVTYAGQTRRTATRLNTLCPDWNVRVVFPLAAGAGAAGNVAGGGNSTGGGNIGRNSEGRGFGSPVASGGGGGEDGGGGGEGGEKWKNGGGDDGKKKSEEGGDFENRGGVLPLRLRVMDWSPLGEPRCIGTASFAVDASRMMQAAKANAAMKSAAEAGLALFTTLFCILQSKHSSTDDTQYGPCNQSDTWE